MLKTERNTPAMGKRIATAARKILGIRKGINVDFEHGQWWVSVIGGRLDGAQYSVVDAEGPNTVDGFDLEMVTEPCED
jgi:hypothetical protein